MYHPHTHKVIHSLGTRQHTYVHTYIHVLALAIKAMRTNLDDNYVRGIVKFRVRLEHLLQLTNAV